MTTGANANPLAAFVRGTWLLLIAQFLIALLVFAVLAYASARLTDILDRTAHAREELQTTQNEVKHLEQRLAGFNAAMPHIRDGIIAFHEARNAADALKEGRFGAAIQHYELALNEDPENAYVLDLMSYAQYSAGLAAAGAGRSEATHDYFESAVETMRRGLAEAPDSLNGYVQLAIYQCQLDQSAEAVQTYEDAAARLGAEAVKSVFSGRLGEIVQRCAPLRERIMR